MDLCEYDALDEESAFDGFVQSCMDMHGCDLETAKTYACYRIDGYSSREAKVFAGLADPSFVE
jgi:hypothetical protein